MPCEYPCKVFSLVLIAFSEHILFQTEIKTGFIFLQSCDGCTSHQKIIEIAQGILLQADALLEMNQPPPSVPQNAADYVGVYTTTIGGIPVKSLSEH